MLDSVSNGLPSGTQLPLDSDAFEGLPPTDGSLKLLGVVGLLRSSWPLASCTAAASSSPLNPLMPGNAPPPLTVPSSLWAMMGIESLLRSLLTVPSWFWYACLLNTPGMGRSGMECGAGVVGRRDGGAAERWGGRAAERQGGGAAGWCGTAHDILVQLFFVVDVGFMHEDLVIELGGEP